MSARRDKSKKHLSLPRRLARGTAVLSVLVLTILCGTGNWYVHHAPEWLDAHASPFTAPLVYFGNRTAHLTDAFGWTGHDSVYATDDPAPEGTIFFAGAPKRIQSPAPADITVLHRPEFALGWSPSLKRPVWAAYHVPREARFESGKRPSFRKDPNVASSPAASAYAGSRYDRGHMVPNHAVVTRFGPDVQKKTFYMTNVSPQTPALNRGLWRELELRIADLWTARYGEIWVIVGAIPARSPQTREKLGPVRVDVPEKYFMLITAQAEDGVRTLAVIIPQTVDRWAFAPRYIVTIHELEQMTGLEFFPDMPSFLKRPLKAERPTRLWPIRLRDAIKLILLRFA